MTTTKNFKGANLEMSEFWEEKLPGYVMPTVWT